MGRAGVRLSDLRGGGVPCITLRTLGIPKGDRDMNAVPITAEYIEGAVSLEEGDYLRPWRLVLAEKELFYPEDGLMAKARIPAGVRVRFETGAPAVTLRVKPAKEARAFDLTCGADILQTVRLPAGQRAVRFTDLGDETRVYEVWLPSDVSVALRALAVPNGKTIGPAPVDRRPRWVAYGSSITQCAGAHSPARTWPATAARMVDLNLTCLGYGGDCHCDPIVAMTMRDLPADVITMKLGINIMGSSSLSPRSYQPAVIGMVRTVRQKHPTTPVGIITSIISPPRETQPNSVGMTLALFREHTAEAVRRLRACGDEHLHLFSGLDLLGEADLTLLPDDLHPNGDGYELIGRRAAELVLPALLADRP